MIDACPIGCRAPRSRRRLQFGNLGRSTLHRRYRRIHRAQQLAQALSKKRPATK